MLGKFKLIRVAHRIVSAATEDPKETLLDVLSIALIFCFVVAIVRAIVGNG